MEEDSASSEEEEGEGEGIEDLRNLSAKFLKRTSENIAIVRKKVQEALNINRIRGKHVAVWIGTFLKT